MKKIILLTSLVVIVIMGMASIAYYTYEQRATNVITSSQVKIRLNLVDENGTDVKGQGMDVMPTRRLTRMASVTNIGKETVWIRICENTSEPWIHFESINTEDWVYQDGYYYYQKKVEPTETTTELFKEVVFDSSIGNDKANQSIVLDVEAQATQVKHNGNTSLEAKGWPEEGGD